MTALQFILNPSLRVFVCHDNSESGKLMDVMRSRRFDGRIWNVPQLPKYDYYTTVQRICGQHSETVNPFDLMTTVDPRYERVLHRAIGCSVICLTERSAVELSAKYPFIKCVTLNGRVLQGTYLSSSCHV